MSVSAVPHEGQTIMPLSAQDRVRQSVAHKVAPDVILARYRAMKGMATARMEDIPPAIMAVLVADVLQFFSTESLNASIAACHRAQAHVHAFADDEAESLARQAQRDVATYGDPLVQAFIRTNPKFCPLCCEYLLTNKADVLITENLRGQAHGVCCSTNPRFEFINEFTYRLLEAK